MESDLALGAVGARKDRLAVAPQRNVQVRRTSGVLRERLGHERRQLAVASGDLLDRVLEPGTVVAGIKCLAVDQVRFNLPGTVFGEQALQGGELTQHRIELAEHRFKSVGVLQRVGVDVVLEDRPVSIEQVELELGTDFGGVPQGLQSRDDAPQDAAGIERRRCPVVIDDVGYDVSHAGPPGQLSERAQVGYRESVRIARVPVGRPQTFDDARVGVPRERSIAEAEARCFGATAELIGGHALAQCVSELITPRHLDLGDGSGVEQIPNTPVPLVRHGFSGHRHLSAPLLPM